jgi:hypothetical protein
MAARDRHCAAIAFADPLRLAALCFGPLDDHESAVSLAGLVDEPPSAEARAAERPLDRTWFRRLGQTCAEADAAIRVVVLDRVHMANLSCGCGSDQPIGQEGRGWLWMACARCLRSSRARHALQAKRSGSPMAGAALRATIVPWMRKGSPRLAVAAQSPVPHARLADRFGRCCGLAIMRPHLSALEPYPPPVTGPLVRGGHAVGAHAEGIR